MIDKKTTALKPVAKVKKPVADVVEPKIETTVVELAVETVVEEKVQESVTNPPTIKDLLNHQRAMKRGEK